tara:strand:+ start:236 stop:397 length:162 start_codon:yes stop_codon:yes gene_type:complete
MFAIFRQLNQTVDFLFTMNVRRIGEVAFEDSRFVKIGALSCPSWIILFLPQAV